ncbi:MAG: hypothetical protein FJW92_03945 [Actinobacteria bacterium]|nr:hypothetical protein [Actinomycetota bacterium]
MKTKKLIKRTYRCTITLSKGRWTVTTTARGTAGVVAAGTRRVVTALAWGESTVGAWQALGIVLLLIGSALGARAHSGDHGDAPPATEASPGRP